MDSENSEYEYAATVFVTGDLRTYVGDLARYFRSSLSDFASPLENRKRQLANLHSMMFDEDQTKGDPFREMNRAKLAEVQLRVDALRRSYQAQRINHGLCMRILEDGEPLESLDITNFAHPDQVIRIVHHTLDGIGPTIRMRIFSNPQNYTFKAGNGFVLHAKSVDGVGAFVKQEVAVSERLPKLADLVENGSIRRSSLRVREPIWSLRKRGDKISYTIYLGEAELEMLRIFEVERERTTLPHRHHLIYGSDMWSPDQSHKLLRNLYGLIGIYQRESTRGGPWFENFFLDPRNKRAARKAVENGGRFTKSVPLTALPFLGALYERSEELRAAYGNRFYPRFSPTEVAHLAGESKEAAIEALSQLVGVLAPINRWAPVGVDRHGLTYKGYIPQVILPRARMGAVREMVTRYDSKNSFS